MRTINLQIELVPNPTMEINLRAAMPKSGWTNLSREVQKRANYQCEICQRKKGDEITRLHCHEVWHFNETTRIQKLERLEAICFQCHMIIHYGYASGQSSIDKDELKQHFCRLNNVTLDDFDKHLSEAVSVWRRRNEIEWIVDFGEFERYVTIDIPRKGSKEDEKLAVDSLFPYIEELEPLFADYYISEVDKGLNEGKAFDEVYEAVLQELIDHIPEGVLSSMKYKTLSQFKSKVRKQTDINTLVKAYQNHA